MDRPRRTIRPTTKALKLSLEEPVSVLKRKSTPEPMDPQKQLKTLLKSSRSDLVALDMQDIINKNTWALLSADARAHLATLLPPTAFHNATSGIGLDHPPLEDTVTVDEPAPDPNGAPRNEDVNLAFFGDAHLLSAERTFQDHLYFNWLSDSHGKKVKDFQEGVINGTLAAPWKDQVWERDNAVPVIKATSSFSLPNKGRAGSTAKMIELSVLAKNGVIRAGDIIAYKRCFTSVDVTVEKDTIIQDIHPKTYALTVLALSGSSKDLPTHLLTKDLTTEGPQPVQSMTITNPTMLETALLDIDGRVDGARRPNGNAWKSLTIWRWRAGAGYNQYDSRGGRENHGTLFYLRACHALES